jgi:hypothetical protein
MKQLIISSFVTLIIGFCLSIKAESQVSQENINQKFNLMSENKIRIKIGEKTFISTLSDNPTAIAFKALLPLTINMNELNNNEKFADLSKNLPINASVPPSIQSGDLMMYGSRTLVLFYKGFSTTYSYTKIGKIDDVSGLAAALGSGDVKVSFELQ